jgi:Tol biopolymer transport system component
MTLAVGQRFGSHEVAGLIGAGGMGQVFRARDTRLGRDVALKVLPDVLAQDPERAARFEREAQVLASLNHPNIASLYGLEEHGGRRALVMELVEGPTLAERIAAGPLDPPETLGIALQVAEALEEAHDKGIVHRDLKPANVKVTADGKVKVLDFGLAKALEGDSTASGSPANSPTLSIAATRAGVILGTAGYMSPEQARGSAADRRADIWAFGVLLYEMLTGKQMFGGPTVSDTLAAVLRAGVDLSQLPPATPRRVRRLLERCLERDKRKRLQAIGEARLILEAGEPEAVEAAPAAPPRSWALWAVAGALAAALAVLGFLHFRQAPPEERMLRFTAPPPEKRDVETFTLSPDGRYLAMASSGDLPALWVRALDALDPQPLAGTEGARYPFWSPDSRWIGYFAQGKLKKVPVTGGPSQTLCEAADGRGGTWNREGVIVFAPDPNGALKRVPAAGGAPAPATELAATKGGIHRFPSFLPDDRHFLFLAVQTGAPETNGAYAGSLHSKELRRVLPDQSSVHYAPRKSGGPGYLFFVRQNTLMSQPFDAGKLELRGEAVPLAEQIGSVNLHYGDFSVSANGVLGYKSGRNLSDAQLTWYDRHGKQLGLVGGPGLYGNVAISPDEKKLAIDRFDTAGQNTDVWVLELARGTASRLTFSPQLEMVPVWSPDGERIVYASLREGRWRIYHKASSGAGQEEKMPDVVPGGEAVIDWSRDRLLAVTVGGATRSDLWFAPAPAGSQQKPVPFVQTEFDERDGKLSPDGRFVVYSSNETGQYEIYVQPAPPTGAKWQISTAGGSQPRWRRDGKELFYLSGDRKLMAVEVRGGTQLEVGTPRSLFAIRTRPFGPTLPHLYDVSADGRRFLVNTLVEDAARTPITVVVNWEGGRK